MPVGRRAAPEEEGRHSSSRGGSGGPLAGPALGGRSSPPPPEGRRHCFAQAAHLRGTAGEVVCGGSPPPPPEGRRRCVAQATHLRGTAGEVVCDASSPSSRGKQHRPDDHLSGTAGSVMHGPMAATSRRHCAPRSQSAGPGVQAGACGALVGPPSPRSVRRRCLAAWGHVPGEELPLFPHLRRMRVDDRDQVGDVLGAVAVDDTSPRRLRKAVSARGEMAPSGGSASTPARPRGSGSHSPERAAACCLSSSPLLTPPLPRGEPRYRDQVGDVLGAVAIDDTPPRRLRKAVSARGEMAPSGGSASTPPRTRGSGSHLPERAAACCLSASPLLTRTLPRGEPRWQCRPFMWDDHRALAPSSPVSRAMSAPSLHGEVHTWNAAAASPAADPAVAPAGGPGSGLPGVAEAASAWTTRGAAAAAAPAKKSLLVRNALAEVIGLVPAAGRASQPPCRPRC